MNTDFKVIIIGGGASGLISAIELTRDYKINGSDILILEKNQRVGKKLIATGNGQANLSNKSLTLDNYYGNKDFIRAFLDTAKKIGVEDYFYSLGIPFYTSEDGRQYPLSKQASAVLDILREIISNLQINILTERLAKKITCDNKKFTIYTDKEVFTSKKVILAIGGKAGKQFGTDGSSYNLATDFGHKLTPLYPSIVQLKTETDKIRGLKGLKETARVTAYENGNLLKSAVGDVLFTEYGLSGNSVFQISSAIASSKNAYVNVEFLPQYSQAEVERLLTDKQNIKGYSFDNILVGIINKRIGQVVLKEARGKTPKDVANALKNFKLKVNGTTGFNNAQVTRGGISTDNIDKFTYESKIIHGLYIVGEALDVDGDCGGYNLTFAFCSGISAAKDIKNKM